MASDSPSRFEATPQERRIPLAFFSFLLSRLAAVFAMQIQAVVVAWQVYDITRDPLSLAYVGLAQFLPMVVLLLPAGDLVDRFNRKYILAISWAVQALCSALLLWLSYTASSDVTGFYAVLALFGCARAFTGPTLQSLLPQIVPRDQLSRAIALNSSIMKIAVIGGPLLGGILYVYGGSLTYAVCLGCFLLGLALLTTVPVRFRKEARPQETTAWKRFTAGIAYIRNKPIILGAISLDLFAVLLGGVIALLPIYAQEILHVGPEGLGALRSAIAIGALLMGIYLGVRELKRNVGWIMFVAVAVFGLANLVFALSTVFWVSWLALLVAGAADMISVNVRITLIQLATPDEMRGRVNAVNMLFIGSSNELGEFRAGTSAAWFGAVPAAVVGGLGTLTVVGLWMKLFPSLRQVSRFEDATQELPAREATA
ncbi:putative MFS family arabinose efflux permease [Modicisalibacter xianhensis]|uniref:Putative MFS family arabinose efflux permease n=1 Tax=Modicisalibacter xianhensis TaxID=442341 RepID=A0A4V3GUN1_9GAMM|nr:MFS transporter [Halomonas xianhensis]TDX31444.1 putative MFS family arabinose efflux permease [Halomonas xianhensis]